MMPATEPGTDGLVRARCVRIGVADRVKKVKVKKILGTGLGIPDTCRFCAVKGMPHP